VVVLVVCLDEVLEDRTRFPEGDLDAESQRLGAIGNLLRLAVEMSGEEQYGAIVQRMYVIGILPLTPVLGSSIAGTRPLGLVETNGSAFMLENSTMSVV